MNAARSLFYFLAVAAPRLGMFVVIFALARILPVDEVGLFVLVVTVGELLEMVAANWVRIYVQNREAGRARISGLRAGRMIGITALGTLVAVAAAVPVALIVVEPRWRAFALAVAVYVVAFGTLRYALGVLQTLRRHETFAQIESVRALAILVTIGAIALASPHSFLGPSLALSLMTLGVGLWGVARTAGHVARPRFSPRGYLAAAAFGLPMIGDTLLTYLVVSFDRFVLNDVAGAAAVGIYGVAYALGRQPIDFVAGPLNNLTVPALFATRAGQGDEAARRMQTGAALTMFILCAGMFAGVVILREEIVQLVLKPAFWPDAIRLMPEITAAACLVMFKMYLYDNVYHLYGRTALKLKIALPVGVASLILTFLLIRWKGMDGAAWALVATSATALAGSVIGTRSFFRFPLPAADMARVALLAALSAGALELAILAARPLGPLAEIVAGFLAFCAVYAAGLTVAGVSIRAMVATPWAPKAPAAQPA